MEETSAPSDRRSLPRYAVDEAANLFIVSRGATLPGRLSEISLEGCRMGIDRHDAIPTPAGIEIMFRLNGIAFRLGGILQWIDNGKTAGIQFSSLAERRRKDLLELLAELEAEQQAKSVSDAAKTAEESREAGASPFPPRSQPDLTATHNESQPAVPDKSGHADVPETNPQVSPNASKSRRDRREKPRHSIDTQATVLFIDVRAEISGRIVDLSMSGCRIRTDERFPVGIYRRVETEFKLDGLPFRLGGVVQSIHDKFTVGVRFLDLSPRKRDQLAALMDEIEVIQHHGRANSACNEASPA
ncbi:MAG TPA: PilZ domain-containing protein [Terracidiphilus sp.]|jgi:hypothetical protein